MSGAVPPPQPPSDPNQPPGYLGAAGANDPGGYLPQPSSMRGDRTKATMKSANPLDFGIVGAGVLAFLLSLFTGYYTHTVSVEGDDSVLATIPGLDDSTSMNAWHGFFGWFAALMALAAAALMILGLAGVIAQKKIVRLGVAAAFGVAALSALLACW
ncbi:MAG: hypothetical protein WKF73_14920 [Nocardioidaceae bacterium]